MKRRWRVAAATTLTVVAIGLCVACGGVEPHAFSAAQVEQIDQRFNETGMQPEYEPLTDEQFRTVCLNFEKAGWDLDKTLSDLERNDASDRSVWAHRSLYPYLLEAASGNVEPEALLSGYCAHKTS